MEPINKVTLNCSNNSLNSKECFICRGSFNGNDDDDCKDNSDFNLNSNCSRDNHENLCRSFCTLAFRYVNLNLNYGNKENAEDFKLKFGDGGKVCENCAPLLKSFCGLYDQLVMVKLRINDHLKDIAELIEFGDFEQAINGHDNDLVNDGDLQELGFWRKPFLERVASMSKEFPQLKLGKVDETKPQNDQNEALRIDIDDDDDPIIIVENGENSAGQDPLKITQVTTLATQIQQNDQDQPKKPTDFPHPKSTVNLPFKCLYCPRSFRYKRNRHTHHIKLHSELMSHDREQPLLKCKYCEKKFCLLRNVCEHEKIHHNSDYQTLDLDCDFDLDRAESDTRGIAMEKGESPISSAAPPVAVRMSSNSNTPSGSRSSLFQCVQCQKKFCWLKNLQDHEKTHLYQESSPEVTTTKAKTVPKSTEYVPRPEMNKPSKCQYCPKRFRYNRSLNDHQTICAMAFGFDIEEVEDQPEPVKDAEFPEKNKNNAETGRRRRKQVRYRNSKCSYCDKFFLSNSDRRRHEMAIHTGERPYQCFKCLKTFTQLTGCRTHLKTVHGIQGVVTDNMNVNNYAFVYLEDVVPGQSPGQGRGQGQVQAGQSATSSSVSVSSNGYINDVVEVEEVEEGEVFKAKTEI